MDTISIETLFEFSFVSRPLISPDGTLVVYAVQRADRVHNGYSSDLYLLLPDGSSTRLTGRGDVHEYLWTAEGKLLFASRAEDGAETRGTQTYLWDRDSGKTERFLSLPEQGAQLLYADSEQILYAATHRLEARHASGRELEAAGDANVSVFDELPFWSNGQGVTNRLRRGVYRLDCRTGSGRRLTDRRFDVEQISVSPGGGRILYTGCRYEGNRPTAPEIRLYEAAGDRDRRLVEARAFDFTYAALWGDEAVMFAVPDSSLGKRLDGDFFRIDLESGQASLLARYGKAGGRGDGVTTDARLGGMTAGAADGEYLYFVSNLSGSAVLCRLSREGKITEYLTGEGSCDSFDARNGRVVVCGMYRNRPCELYEQGAQVTHWNDSLFGGRTVPEPEVFRFTDRDGFVIEGWCIRPAGYRQGGKYPAVLEIHGGPRAMYGPVFHHEMQVLAASGYFVLYCNPRGSDGYGDAFADIEDRYGEVDYRNLMSFVDHMLERYPEIDSRRLGVAGGSYGGYMTNWIVGHTDRFAAAVSQRSTANWISFTFTGDMSTIYDPLYVKHLELERVARAWELSPLRCAPQAKTPTLFIQADEDYRCFMCDAVMMYSALRLQGVEARLCLFHGENHSLSRAGRPLARIRRLRELVAWFDRYLKGEGPWKDTP